MVRRSRQTVTVDGLAELRRRLAEVPEEVADAAREAVDEGAEAIREEVERTVRVNTGRARNTIRVRHVGTTGLSADVGWFDPDLYYMRFNEFGTEKITADPVLTRAAEAERVRFPRRVGEEIRRELEG